MIGKFGSDQQQLADLGGGIISENGATLLSGESTGEASLLAGPALIREQQAGCANGDFAIAPPDETATITANNPLPYWTFTDTSSSGAITCALVADAGAGSGYVLRWNIAAGTGIKSAKITRYIPVPASRDRAFVFIPEAFLGTRTGTNFSVTLAYSWATIDLTATGTGDSKTISTGATLLAVDTTPLNSAAPADAAFVYVTLTIATTGTTSGTTTQDIAEIRLHRGDQGLYITDTSSASFAPARISSTSNVLKIEASTGAAYPISFKTGAAVGNAIIVVGDGVSGGAIQGGAGVGRLNMLTADQSAYANVVADRFYPGGQVTRYIDDDGTRTLFSAGIEVNASSTMTTVTATDYNASTTGVAFDATGGGDVGLTGADTSVPITGNGEVIAIPNTTTATTNSARWVLISGSTYGLRRDSSTRRVKTNIVQADAAVLAAAKRLRAVHFEPLEKDEEGNLRGTGQLTLGLIAEEIVEAGLGCAVTYDSEGLPDGYDERVLMAAMLHHIGDLEARLAALESR